MGTIVSWAMAIFALYMLIGFVGIFIEQMRKP